MRDNKGKESHRVSANNDISLWDILDIFYEKKVLILVYSVFAALIVACVSFYTYINSPSSKSCVLNFSLMFDGVNKGKYPNGTKFVDSDIISTPVLQNVYDNNKLKQYFGSFGNFKNTISIQRYNPGLAFLNFEYKAKLEDRKISSAERYEIEQNFYRQTAGMNAKPVFALVLNFPDPVKYNFPESLSASILNDTLSVWLSRAKRYQGITKYNVSLISNRVGKNFIEKADYFNGADLMRLLLNDLSNDIIKLEQIPNTKYLRLEYDGKTFSFQDLRLRVDYIKKYILEPLLETIRTAGAYKNLQDVLSYAIAQINSLEIEADILSRKKDNYEQMLLERYTASLEPIFKINTEEVSINNEILFYKKFLKSLESSNKKISSNNEIRIASYQNQLIDAENNLIDLIETFYNKICNVNLESDASFYKINSYSSHIFRNLNIKPLVLRAVLAFFVMELLLIIPLLIIGLYKLRKKEGINFREDVQLRDYTNLRSLPERSQFLDNRKGLSERSHSLDRRERISNKSEYLDSRNENTKTNKKRFFT